jgi:hypothetical protein
MDVLSGWAPTLLTGVTCKWGLIKYKEALKYAPK